MPQFTATDGTRLFYTDEGRGDVILCLAGLTRNGGDFDHLAPQLADARMIRLDMRGRGRSDHAEPASYTIPREAADAVALLDHLEIDRAAIVGTSRGGLIGLWLAATVPARLRGLLLNDIGPVIERRGLEVIKGYLGRRPAQKTWEEAAQARARLWTAFRDVPHSRWLHEVRNHYVEGPDGLSLRYDARLREAVLATWDQPQPDLWPLFDGAAGLPLAVLRGDGSDILSRATLADMMRRRPDLIAAEVAGRGHVPFLDEPESQDVISRWRQAMP